MERGLAWPQLTKPVTRMREYIECIRTMWTSTPAHPVRYAEFCGGHHFLCWRGTLADGVRALLDPAARGGAPAEPPSARER